MVKTKRHLIGETFGMLTVLEQTDDYVSPTGHKTSQWKCQCSCEKKKIVIVAYNNLVSGNSKSCGCQKHKKGIFHPRLRVTNTYDLSGEYGKGYTQKGEEFWFDKEDYELIKDYCWRFTGGYLMSKNRNTKNNVFFHRLVMGAVANDMVVDHKIHPKGKANKYDNRKSNLEIKTRSQNNMNSYVSSRSSTGVKGVTYDSKKKKWQARICKDYVRYHLGWFDNIEDAIQARKDAEKKYYGKYDISFINGGN